MSTRIKKITALQVIDSRAMPTVEAHVELTDGTIGTAIVPSGASTGSNEALELRDGDNKKFGGKGVLKAVNNVNTTISIELAGKDPFDQRYIDELLLELDGTENKSNLGANALLAVSLATARAAANFNGLKLFEYLRTVYWPEKENFLMPAPMMNVLNGGKHAIGSVNMQEFMIMPVGAPTFHDAVRWGSEIYLQLKSIIHAKGLPVGVGDEGGFMPKLSSHEEVLELLVSAIESAGYVPETDVVLAMDPAASEFYENNTYNLTVENKTLTTDQLVDLYADWTSKYPIASIEDGLHEQDWDGFQKMTEKLGNKIQIVGDDLFVTNIKFLQKGIDQSAANSILIKVNQIGTLSETVNAINLAHDNNFTSIVSHRSGETEDSFIADLVVASNAGQIKTGAPCRSDRVAKYNQLLRIESYLGDKAEYKNPFK